MDESETHAMKEHSDELAGTSELMCEICEVSEAKYRCPQCFIETCSVLCIKKHKQGSQCDGVTRRTRHIPMGEMDDLTFLHGLTFESFYFDA